MCESTTASCSTGAEQLERARAQLTQTSRTQAARLLGCAPDKLDGEVDALATKARSGEVKLQSTPVCATGRQTAATRGRQFPGDR